MGTERWIYMEITRKKESLSMDMFMSSYFVPKPMLGAADTAEKKINSWLWFLEGHCLC